MRSGLWCKSAIRLGAGLLCAAALAAGPACGPSDADAAAERGAANRQVEHAAGEKPERELEAAGAVEAFAAEAPERETEEIASVEAVAAAEDVAQDIGVQELAPVEQPVPTSPEMVRGPPAAPSTAVAAGTPQEAERAMRDWRPPVPVERQPGQARAAETAAKDEADREQVRLSTVTRWVSQPREHPQAEVEDEPTPVLAGESTVSTTAVGSDRPDTPAAKPVRGVVGSGERALRSEAQGNDRVTMSHPVLGTLEVELAGNDLARIVPRVSQRPAVAGDDPNQWRTGRAWAPNNEDDDTGRNLGYLMAGDFVVLEPGGGWDGPTDEPPPVGEPQMPGYDAKAIARWDVVPYQTITEDFHIGVVAFHINGIEEVLFSVNKGPWVPVKKMQLNPRTGVWEYTVVLRPELFEEDGLIEVRAVAVPRGAGVPRLLAGPISKTGEHSIFLNSNYHGTWGAGEVYVSPSGSDSTGDGSRENPFATIWRGMQIVGTGNADGLTVYLEAGEYEFGGGTHPIPKTSRGWVTIKPAPGVQRDEVILIGGGRFRTTLVRFKDLTFDHTDNVGSIGRYDALEPAIWLDNISATALRRTEELVSGQHFAAAYMTGCTVTGYRDGAEGMQLVRNVQLHKLGSDAFGDSGLVLNSSVRDIRVPDGETFHPDVYQFSGNNASRDNTIVYGLLATNVDAQGIFADDLFQINNSAFVNVFVSATGGAKSQWKDVISDHLLLWHVTILGQSFTWRTPHIGNLSVVGCIWEKVEASLSDAQQAGFAHNHFIDIHSYGATAYGTDISYGVITDETRGVLHHRVRRPLVPADIVGATRPFPASVGAHEASVPTE